MTLIQPYPSDLVFDETVEAGRVRPIHELADGYYIVGVQTPGKPRMAIFAGANPVEAAGWIGDAEYPVESEGIMLLGHSGALAGADVIGWWPARQIDGDDRWDWTAPDGVELTPRRSHEVERAEAAELDAAIDLVLSRDLPHSCDVCKLARFKYPVDLAVHRERCEGPRPLDPDDPAEKVAHDLLQLAEAFTALARRAREPNPEHRRLALRAIALGIADTYIPISESVARVARAATEGA